MLCMLPVMLLAFSCLLALFFASGGPGARPAAGLGGPESLQLSVVCESPGGSPAEAARYACTEVYGGGAQWTIWYAEGSRWCKGYSDVDLKEVFASFAAAAAHLDEPSGAEKVFVLRVILTDGTRTRTAAARGTAQGLAQLYDRGGTWAQLHDQVTGRIDRHHWVHRLADPAAVDLLPDMPRPIHIDNARYGERHLVEW